MADASCVPGFGQCVRGAETRARVETKYAVAFSLVQLPKPPSNGKRNRRELIDLRHVAAGLVETGDETELDWILADRENSRNYCVCRL